MGIGLLKQNSIGIQKEHNKLKKQEESVEIEKEIRGGQTK